MGEIINDTFQGSLFINDLVITRPLVFYNESLPIVLPDQVVSGSVFRGGCRVVPVRSGPRVVPVWFPCGARVACVPRGARSPRGRRGPAEHDIIGSASGYIIFCYIYIYIYKFIIHWGGDSRLVVRRGWRVVAVW